MLDDLSPNPRRGRWRFWEVDRWDLTKLPVVMAWIYALNLIFFPTWLFGNEEPAGRLRALALIIIWIIASSLLLWYWLRHPKGSTHASLQTGPSSQTPQTESSKGQANRQWVFLLGLMVILAVANLVAAAYPLTSSGDEAYHASTFKGIGRNLATLLHFWPGWLLPAGALLAMAAAWFWQRVRRRVAWQNSPALGLLVAAAVVFVPIAWLAVDRIISNGVVSAAELFTLIRFQPLSKFLWLPISLCCWGSVFALRLPSILCWLLSGVVLFGTVRLRDKSNLSLLPPIFLLVMPGMFFYAHLIYITTPMILLWCIAFYFYEHYWLVNERRFLLLAAVTLNLGNLMRVETGYLTLAIMIHWVLLRLVKDFNNLKSYKGIEQFVKHYWLDFIALGWFGLSFIPLWMLIPSIPQRGFAPVKGNLFDLSQLLAVANEYPFHNGLLITAILLVCSVLVILRLRSNLFRKPYLLLSLILIFITYFLFTFDYLVVDFRKIGLFEFSSEWQSAHRFLVSWTPFVALLLAEGVTSLPWPKLRLPAGLVLAGVMLAQATFWAEPFTLPEFTSLALRPGVEYPNLPAKEVLDYVSKDVAGPNDKIFLSPHFGAEFYLDTQPHPQNWVVDHWEDYDLQTTQKFIAYCEKDNIDVVILSLVWMNLPGTRLEVAEDVMHNDRFEVVKVFDYLGKPAIVVARFRH